MQYTKFPGNVSGDFSANPFLKSKLKRKEIYENYSLEQTEVSHFVKKVNNGFSQHSVLNPRRNLRQEDVQMGDDEGQW
ncbi:hypothetical protein TNCT_668941 [Trichonephila clavata]|uniref:Uncharacterized protein n=1 Tax=Trichonephila clavata TaxID=2740835 RepID=A0A8X6J246_TRICU|nr:hypothetical protein TNCT_722111 [Trichonephila clavata]GFR06638.1 hypothetical protein TNCT_668941 [Trichonephila clavata]